MAGLIEPAAVYVNGLAALLFVFVLPGAAIVYGLPLPSFPQRWLAAILSSLATNYFAVTLIAQFHLDPLLTYRMLAAVTMFALVCMTVSSMMTSASTRGRSLASLLDLKWLLGSLVVLALAYFNIWKQGVPHVFQGSDVSVSWNVWALIWAEGQFPTTSYGYPQFIPALWAVTYIFTGTDIQYFAFYIYVALIIVPIVMAVGTLARISAWLPVAALVTHVWFVAEIREPWLRATFLQGFPDWVAAIFGFWGVVLFVASLPGSPPQDENRVNHFLALGMLSLAAATKPLYGLFVLSVLAGVCTDAARQLPAAVRRRLIVAAVGLVLAFVIAYAISYSHLTVRSMPSYPVTELSERLSRAARLYNGNFTIVFRVLIAAGLVLSPFLPRIRWLTLPLLIGIGLWANTASYDLRNVLGFFMICAFVSIYAAGRMLRLADIPKRVGSSVADGAVVLGTVVLSLCLTFPLARSDELLRKRFADDQLRTGLGLEFNQKIGELLAKGCIVFAADGYISTISAFRPFKSQMEFFHYPLPLTDILVERFNRSTGCVAFFYPPTSTHRSILDFIGASAEARHYRKVADDRGMELLVSDPGSNS